MGKRQSRRAKGKKYEFTTANAPTPIQTTANSVDEWIALARSHKIAALLQAEHKETTTFAYISAGHGVECAIKAYIMHHRGWNAWPDKASEPDLYEHGLSKLAPIAGLAPLPSDPVAPSWKVFLRWNIKWRYSSTKMSRNFARGACEAAFGTDGVASWLVRLCGRTL